MDDQYIAFDDAAGEQVLPCQTMLLGELRYLRLTMYGAFHHITVAGKADYFATLEL